MAWRQSRGFEPRWESARDDVIRFLCVPQILVKLSFVVRINVLIEHKLPVALLLTGPRTPLIPLRGGDPLAINLLRCNNILLLCC